LKFKRIIPGDDQESVWDYPRPPRLENTKKHIRIIFQERVIADTRASFRVLETSHPPVYYLPPADIRLEYFELSDHKSFCEWKGVASYYHIKIDDRKETNAAWYYPKPESVFTTIKDYVAFYAHKMDQCYVDDELVVPQPGGFYGGWITNNIVGPFKGLSGTRGW
jgi:uncharacterized protein (DUF427 family)